MKRFVLILLFVGACAPAETVWTKRDYTPEAFNGDSYDCIKEAYMLAIFRPPKELYERCMMALGWSKEK